MRFKKGDKVEVMNSRDMPISWRTGEVLFARGHSYTILYELCPDIASDRVVERVMMDSVRPCPPLVPGGESFDAGDVVEVFHEYSWRAATILKILGVQQVRRRNKAYKKQAATSQCLVMLLGCSLQFIINMSNIRMRRTWHDGKWILMEKNFRASADSGNPKISYQETNSPLHQYNSKAKDQGTKGGCIGNFYDALVREPTEISLRSQKRTSPFDSSIADLHPQHVRKLRIVESRGMKQKVAADPFSGKVHAVAHPREFWGVNNMHASVNILSNRYSQMERTKYINHIGYSGVRNFKLSTDDSDTCSVGSCSITSRGTKCFFRDPIAATCVEAESVCSDAESRCDSESEIESTSLPLNQELEVSIHWLELDAYRSTLEALYVSGPLTWDHETLLTNLRMMLHISNDEHMKELKHLISTKKS